MRRSLRPGYCSTPWSDPTAEGSRIWKPRPERHSPKLFRQWTVSLYLSGLDPAAALEGAYRSIDPRGELEDWVLAGPRVSSVGPSRPDDFWVAQGTTTHYAIIEGFPDSRGVTIDISGPREAEIQVTLIPLPDGLGRPVLTVRRQNGPDGQLQIRAEVTERDGTPVRLGALAWEPLVPAEDPRKPTCRRGGLDMLGIARAFGTSALRLTANSGRA